MNFPFRILLLIFSLFISITHSLPTCHDTIPFATKFANSSLVVYGDIIETTNPFSSNNNTQTFNITFLVKCILKGDKPTNENIIIEHSLPGNCISTTQIIPRKYYLDNPICYRTLINSSTYVYFLHQTNIINYYQQMPFHELLFNEDTTVEILRRTCGIQTRPFHVKIKQNENEIDDQCPIVSIGCQ